MKEKIVLKKRSTSNIVTLPNGTTFTARYERISRKQLRSNIRVKKVQTVGPRNRNRRILSVGDANLLRNILGRKKVRFNSSAIALKRMRKNKRKQTGKGLASNLVNLGIRLGSQALNSTLGKKLINKGIDSIPNVFKYGLSKIKNKNVQRALDSDHAKYVVDEAQNQVRTRSNGLFDLLKKNG